jgi:hypothetical protein
MPRGKPSPKLAITVAPDVYERIRAVARKEGVSISAWLTDAARDALLRLDGLAAIEQWEREHGRFTEAEMKAARKRVRSMLSAKRT